ncbi:MAG: type II secretion system minor pseudopilin GspK [Pseudomonas oryzihabitans]
MRRQRGVALLMALWALALVAALLPVLLAEGRVELQRARLLEHETLARALAAGAERVVAQGLVQAGARQRPEFWRSLRGEVLAYEVEGATVRAQLRDLHGCFNVNALAGPERELALRQLQHLLAQRPGGLGEPGLTAKGFAERLADWVDGDGEAHEFGLETPEALRLAPPLLVPSLPLVEIGEVDQVAPARPGRHLQLRELCALPETSGWRLNANALDMRQLPLLEALFLGEVPGETLQLLIAARPLQGYADVETLRKALPGVGEETFSLLTQRLILNSGDFLLGVEVSRDGQVFRQVRQLAAQGVSRWHAGVPAQRVQLLATRDTTLWVPGPGGAEVLQ